MSDLGFQAMAWIFRLVDLFSSPARKLARLPLRSGMTVVDYACGPGRYTVPVAEFVGPEGKVYAVDIQPLAIRMVETKAAKAGVTNVEARVVRAYDSGIPGACAELVLLLDAFHGIGDRAALLGELRRIIRPDGVLLIEPGHMNQHKARAIVEATGLFRHTETRGKDLWFEPSGSGRRN